VLYLCRSEEMEVKGLKEEQLKWTMLDVEETEGEKVVLEVTSIEFRLFAECL
jgi:hypothetical protein